MQLETCDGETAYWREERGIYAASTSITLWCPIACFSSGLKRRERRAPATAGAPFDCIVPPKEPTGRDKSDKACSMHSDQ